MAETATFRAGSGDPLVLLHIGANPWKKGVNACPPQARYDVFVPTYAGFEGGPPLSAPATIAILADGVEAEMDKAGIGRAHVVGNSLGGWLAMELARRGRARSALALSPGGGWVTRWGRLKVLAFFRFNRGLDRISGPVKPWALRVPILRKLLMRTVIEHGDRVTRDQALSLSSDSMRGARRDFTRLLAIRHEVVQPYPDPGVPTLVVWAREGPAHTAAPGWRHWRKAAPHAEWRVCPASDTCRCSTTEESPTCPRLPRERP